MKTVMKNTRCDIRKYKEEKANFLTHYFGFLMAVIGFFFLIVYAKSTGSYLNLACCTIYGVSLLTLFGASSIYHYMSNKKWKRFFRRIDHLSIYLLIAGSYTPFTLINMKNNWGWHLFLTVWILTLVGFVMKIFFFGKYERFSVILYLLMGWLVIVAVKPLFSSIEISGFIWLFAGGIVYSLGVIFFVMDKKPYFHAIWHFFVLGGSFCHYIAIFFYVLPRT